MRTTDTCEPPRGPDVLLLLYSDAAHAFLFQHAEGFARQVIPPMSVDEAR